jgi:hypothetical protein
MTGIDRDVGVKIVCVLQRPKLGEQACKIVLIRLERFCRDDVVLDADRPSHPKTVQSDIRVSKISSATEARPPTDL